MISKASIEQLLHINGIAPTASDEEIKSVLLSARWHDEDVDTAMLVLRENLGTHESHVDTLHKVFRSDDRLAPDAVSYLLGIEMDASNHKILPKAISKRRTLFILIFVSLVTFCMAMAFIAGGMWMLEVGPFHQTV